MLDNQRHELFAQYLACGTPANQAYVMAGYKYNEGNCIRLKGNEKIIARVRELQERAQKANDVTLESLTERYNSAIDKAANEGSHPAVMAGLAGLAKLHGLIVDKHRDLTGLDEMTDDALAKHIESRLKQLGQKRVEESGARDRGVREAPTPEPDPELSSVSEAE